MLSRPIIKAAVVLVALCTGAARPSTQTPRPIVSAAATNMFAPGPPIAVGLGSASPVLADFNGDGHLDLFTRHLLQSRTAVHLGDGRGRFTSPPPLALQLPWQPGNSALADLNGDGQLDAIFAHKDDVAEYVSVYLGTTTGAFTTSGTPMRTRTAFAYYKAAVFVADANEDGRPDVLTSNGRRASMDLLLGDGRGGLAAATSAVDLPNADGGWFFAVGDIDSDRHVDVVATASYEDGTASRFIVARGNGKGSFALTQTLEQTLSVGERLVAARDVNGDGRLDLILKTGRRLSVRTSQGNGRLGPASTPVTLPAETFDVVVADANRDGQPDLIVATEDSVTVLVAERGAFVLAPGSRVDAGPGAYAVAAGDVNEDGKLDIVASSFGGDRATLLLGW